MKKYIWILISLMMPYSAFGLPAFPGAEGFGSDTVGGRNASATVCIVDTLSDNAGDGQTLRECVQASGPRYIVFKVSGIIHLTSNLVIANDYVTIAGQTSPGGIMIAGYPTQIWAHDVIITHIRFRIGTDAIDYAKSGSDILYYTSPQYSLKADAAACLSGNSLSSKAAGGYPCALTSGGDPEQMDTLNIFGNSRQDWFPGADAYNVILDHCSISWGVDETVEIGTGAHDITISNSIISEGLSRAGHPKGEHSKGLLVNGKEEGSYNISLHHNYFASNHERNPLVAGVFSGGDPGDRWTDLVNNVAYNFYLTLGMGIEENGAGNWVHNYTREDGPDSTNTSYDQYFVSSSGAPDANNLIYVQGNLGAYRTSQSDSQWSVQDGWADSLVTTNYQKANPYDTGEYAVTTTTMSLTYAGEVVSGAGATKPVTDSVDTRLKNEWTNGTGAIPVDMTDAQIEYPTFDTPAAPTDSDNDGMSDAWETSTFGDLDQTANTDFDSDGYSDLEEYIHYLGGYSSEEDEVDPIVAISDADPKTLTSGYTTTLGFTASDANGIDECKWRSGSAPDETHGTLCTGTTSGTCSVTGLVQGNNSIYVGCADPSNNWGSDSIVVNAPSYRAQAGGSYNVR